MDISTKMNLGDMLGIFNLEPPMHQNSGKVQRSTGLELEERCAAILKQRGFRVEGTPRSNDGGIDLIASRTDEVGIDQWLYIQCKDHARPVGVDVVRELLGALPLDRKGNAVLVSTSGVTAAARQTADEKNVFIWDEDKLFELESNSLL